MKKKQPKKEVVNLKIEKSNKRVVNLPSVKLPIKPMTVEELDKDIKRRIGDINKEFKKGFDFIKSHEKSVTFFGSARLKKNSPHYKKATSLGKRIAEAGYTVITGGGPGIMEAGNLGAIQAYGESLGLTIELPEEQNVNPYVTDHCEFYYFFTRKVCLTFAAEAYVYFPGGYGTLDEFFEILTLVQTHKIQKVPIILVGNEFWRPLEKFIKQQLYQEFETISKSDMKLYHILEDEDKIIDIIKRAPVRWG